VFISRSGLVHDDAGCAALEPSTAPGPGRGGYGPFGSGPFGSGWFYAEHLLASPPAPFGDHRLCSLRDYWEPNARMFP
jgi:hypothetical protein